MSVMQRSLDQDSTATEFLRFRTSAEGHLHAFQCRDLAATCLTQGGERALREMAEEYAQLAEQLEQLGY
jgi:hypothetical protein